MKKICLLTCKEFPGFVPDEQVLVHELEKNHEYKLYSHAWEDDADWASFDLVVVRTTWNYTKHVQEFLKKLKHIGSQTKLMNSAELIEWNHHKGYLKELEEKGVKIIPTQMFKLPGNIIPPVEWKDERFIIKPAISATAFKTIIVNRADLNSNKIKDELFAGDWLLQPYLEEIKQGEVSLCFFNKKYSHGAIKIPKSGDFRVQEEWGGEITKIEPDQKLLDVCQSLVNTVPFELLYGRVDLLAWKGDYYLMELELIEPALYFRTNPEAAKNFKAALDKIFTSP